MGGLFTVYFPTGFSCWAAKGQRPRCAAEGLWPVGALSGIELAPGHHPAPTGLPPSWKPLEAQHPLPCTHAQPLAPQLLGWGPHQLRDSPSILSVPSGPLPLRLPRTCGC